MSPPTTSSSSSPRGPLVVPLLVTGMLLTGICNSLFTKYQDQQCVDNCDAADPTKHVEFNQPVLQTGQMFVGECLCFVPPLVGALRRRWGGGEGGGSKAKYTALPTSNEEAADEEATVTPTTARQPPPLWTPHAWLFALPALCDLTGTTLMNVGLILTPVSIYQMTRGALVLWVGVFSVLFLRRHLHAFQWAALCTVMLGVSVVGLSGTILREQGVEDGEGVMGALRVVRRAIAPEKDEDKEVPPALAAFLGVIIILFAQLFTATQFVLEEKIMHKHDIEALLAVSYEGLFGLSAVLIASPLLHYFYGSTPTGRGGYFDLSAGWRQMTSNSAVLWSSVAIALSIALFNGCGLAVTRAISATARSTIDTCRTLGIWVASLALGWEVLTWRSGPAQASGFALLVYGTLVFNGIVAPPKVLRPAAGVAAVEDDATAAATPVAITPGGEAAAATGVLVDAEETDRRRAT